jgi:molybdopterin synthase catalytic subunit
MELIRSASVHDGPLPATLTEAARLARADQGAVASFLGIVRDHSRGRAVTRLHYEGYRPMAEKIMRELIEESCVRFDDQLQAVIAHGLGTMLPGQISLIIQVGSAHRAAAFDACRHLLERIKQDLPVWKQEFYTDGSSVWLKGS